MPQIIPLTPAQAQSYMEMQSMSGAVIQQPAANLQSTQANTANTKAALPGVTATSNSNIANAKIAEATANQLSVRSNAEAVFDSANGHGSDGYVNPVNYNNYRNQYISAGGDPKVFDSYFQTKVNPNNIWYNTPDNIDTRGNLKLITQVINSYRDLPQNQVGPTAHEYAQAWAQMPIFGPAIAQNRLAQANAHDDMLKANAATIKSVINQNNTGGYPLRNLTELGNMVNILPTSYDDTKQAEAKITNLDNLLTAKYGLGDSKTSGVQVLEQLFPAGGKQ